jgi:hypothetical protein
MAADRSKRNETETQQKTGRAPLDATQRKKRGNNQDTKIKNFIEIQTTSQLIYGVHHPPFLPFLIYWNRK